MARMKCKTMAVLFGVAAGLAASGAEARLRLTPSAGATASGRVIQQGTASWYGPGFHGRRTANGETFDTHALTAAHRTLPFGTEVQVINPKNGRSIVVRINDRGPYAHGRIIDLSLASAHAIGITATGTGSVTLVRR